VVLTIILAALAAISLVLGLWQYLAARRFPLHRREGDAIFAPGISILKPLKGLDAETAGCLRSWLTQKYSGPVEILFGAGSEEDPVCEVVRRLIQEHSTANAQLIICRDRLGLNAKVSKLAQLARCARHKIICVSDADVFAPPDFLCHTVQPLRKKSVGLVNALYRFAKGPTFEMQLEALAVNADFWSQVLQARSLGPMRFALGAAMMLRREKLDEIHGFSALMDYLADDYELGRRVAETGARVELGRVVVECRSAPLTAREVWNHQVRWARTIRACRPWAYFFSILANATLWPVLWAAARPEPAVQLAAALCLGVRMFAAWHLEKRMTGVGRLESCGLALLKDLGQACVWAAAFLGRGVVWRGEQYRVERGGKLARPEGSEVAERLAPAPPAS